LLFHTSRAHFRPPPTKRRGADQLLSRQRDRAARLELVCNADRAQALLHHCVAIFTASSFACGAAPTLGFILVAVYSRGPVAELCNRCRSPSFWRAFRLRSEASPWRCLGSAWCAPRPRTHTGGWLTDAYSWRYAFYINIRSASWLCL